MKKTGNSYPDTNVIIRYLIKDDERLYSRAKDFFDEVRTGDRKAVVLESVIAESIYVLMKIYQVPRERAAGSIVDILHYKGVVNGDRNVLIKALDLFVSQDLDIVDCILCAKAHDEGAVLISFDRDLLKTFQSS